jgi:hypothetical protein
VAGLLLLLVLLAVVAVRAADLLLAAIALGAYGFVMSLIWAALGALDVAFTERSWRRRHHGPLPRGPAAHVPAARQREPLAGSRWPSRWQPVAPS